MKAILALADGTIFEGESFGAPGETVGEIVFNTSMTGYQEILTDPSYNGQIVTMTYPLIGNYGWNKFDTESVKPQVEGFIVREYSNYHSNWRSEGSLGDYLTMHGIVGIQGIDTRALTKRLRINGVMEGTISTDNLRPEPLVRKARNFGGMGGRDLVKKVTCTSTYQWEEPAQKKHRVVAIDFGIKHNILRMLQKHHCELLVVPAKTSADEILANDPDGIFLSNGPGDPDAIDYGVQTIRGLIGKKPIFGICLGHQLMSLAIGAKTFKLKFGHRGSNHPVQHLDTKQIEITSQNHGFCVDIDSLPNSATITHINLNDQTLEGIELTDSPTFSVQYHPEASPGPHDASYLFQKFSDLMSEDDELDN
ncbi:TPA: glutamine-hydrolyzing carbamoyl-phosphate synthase small subunit [Candidatus Poribacteria bacterium]|nr:glutamine-hydrolyzing carbamoyl-phosphate synthase small subunit [Candidatus Poribacteria bacterium]HIC00292.1 glutamine-hydrolyzing carbamoyl-phosphate synthase small subunit [Candidatus Poribacteria bacterium]HIO47893.1 carbamoyl-phosphate synthase small subunit [Candidatus Poribacteria bacterium]